MASFFPEDAETIDGVTPGAVGLLVLAAATATPAQQAMDVEVGVDVQAYSANLTEVATVNPGATGLDLLEAATAADAQDVLGLSSATGGSLPTLPVASTNLNYALDPDHPSLIARLVMTYPMATIADMETSLQGFSIDNPTVSAIAAVATGGLNPGVARGFIRMTPDVSTARTWNSAVRDAERIYKTYSSLPNGVGAPEAQVWIAGMRVPSSVTAVTQRLISFALSDASSASRVVRAAIRYNGSWNIYNDSPVDNASVATTAGVVNDVVWFAFVRTGQAVRIYYYLGGGTAPPALSSFTAWTEHAGLLTGSAVAAQVGFTYETGTDTTTAFAGDILYYDDSGGLPDNVAARWRRSALGVVAYLPLPACGYSLERPELIIAQGICTTGLTQDKLRDLLAACENHRTGLDTAAWEWKVERNTSNSYSGGTFADAASFTVSGSGPYLRVTVRPPADGTSPGSLDLVTLRQWSTA